MTLGTPLAAYARWQVRDGLWRAFVPVILFLGMGGIPLWSVAAQRSLAEIRAAGDTHEMASRIYTSTMTLSMTLGAVMLLSGLVATDRSRQYIRFLFAAPVSPWRYYLQQYVIGVTLFAVTFALVPLGFSAVFFDVPVLPVIRSAALYGLLVGALATLAGALFDRDGVIFIIVALASATLQQLERASMLSDWAGALARGLPPFGVLDEVRNTWLAGRVVDANDILLIVGYAAAMLAMALWIIRRAPLAR